MHADIQVSLRSRNISTGQVSRFTSIGVFCTFSIFYSVIGVVSTLTSIALSILSKAVHTALIPYI